ncbi:hypothetical protein RON43_01015 [Lactobacillus gasseri]|uniref:hypothetical protein n=1 Tax=Lactobacillus gasseri TaxID=1596 RepID=UPI0028ED2E20|nr:hypothetical protein [Lactobacillus gasseri]MDT9589687.1 hypothetical protein [Lactobacillus gasseri]MDT9610932.1 hypothetical protein [Lactobacillus gasseri]
MVSVHHLQEISLLPEFVKKRIDWVSHEMQAGMGLTFQGAFRALLDIDDEKSIREDWECWGVSEYMTVSDKYREWLQDPILHDIRRVAVMVGFIYA